MPEAPPPLDPSQMKEQMRQDWAMAAAGWRKWGNKIASQSRPITQALLGAVDPRPGMNILDVACGAGDPALSLARAVSPGGHVTATDLVPEMLAVAQENAQIGGLTNVAFKQADPEDLPFAEGSFDAATCRFGIMFFPDVRRALQGIRRTLKPRGKAVFAAWGAPEQNPWLSTPMAVVVKYAGLPPPPPGALHPFDFATPGMLAHALEGAGFSHVKEEALNLQGTWEGSPGEGWDMVRDIAAPLRRALKEVPTGKEKAMVAEILENLGKYYNGTRLKFPMVVNMATATP